MTERDQILVEYAKASGAFYFAAHIFCANRTNENMLEAQNYFNNLMNREFPKVQQYYNNHKGESDAESLFEIADTDFKNMTAYFVNLKSGKISKP